MVSVLVLTLYDHAVALDLDVLGVADNRKAKVLGDLRTNLCGISIDRLTASDDQIVL